VVKSTIFFHLNAKNLIGMLFKSVLFFVCFMGVIACKSQGRDSTLNACDSLHTQKPNYTWRSLAKGIDLIETDAPERSILGDSKLTILRIDPKAFDFYLITATQYKTKKTVCEWADTFALNIVMNAGMYDLSNGLINKGFMKVNTHYNNRKLNPSYKAMIAMHPTDSSFSKMDILDLQCNSWESVNHKYHSYAQGMRMLDCSGKPLGWNKRNQSCSMLVAAKDAKGHLYYIFTRSPYTHNQMIRFMLDFPFSLTNAIYLEGGPETSLYVCIGETVLEKVGSYVSDTYPTDKNEQFWRLPNVMGLKAR
jgi:hypothetical protein